MTKNRHSPIMSSYYNGHSGVSFLSRCTLKPGDIACQRNFLEDLEIRNRRRLNAQKKRCSEIAAKAFEKECNLETSLAALTAAAVEKGETAVDIFNDAIDMFYSSADVDAPALKRLANSTIVTRISNDPDESATSPDKLIPTSTVTANDNSIIQDIGPVIDNHNPIEDHPDHGLQQQIAAQVDEILSTVNGLKESEKKNEILTKEIKEIKALQEDAFAAVVAMQICAILGYIFGERYTGSWFVFLVSFCLQCQFLLKHVLSVDVAFGEKKDH